MKIQGNEEDFFCLVLLVVAQEGTEQEDAQEGAGQEVAQEAAGQKEAEGDKNNPWQQQGRHRFECPICGLGQKTKGQIKHHMTTHDKQEDSQFNCKDCQYQSNNRDQLNQHVETTHKNVTEYECKLCNNYFETRNDLNIHSKETHKWTYKPCRNFPSKNCEYDSECNFNRIILNQGEHTCFKCGDVFSSKTPLLKHIKSVHGEETCKRFQDNKCSFGEKCFFKHVITHAQPVANILRKTPCQHTGFLQPSQHRAANPVGGRTRPKDVQHVDPNDEPNDECNESKQKLDEN